MIAPIFFIDKSFDAQNISNYHLSLQVFLKGFSFCLLDRQKNKFVALGHYYYQPLVSYAKSLELLEKKLQENELLSLPFVHIKIIFDTPKYTFIPSSFFSEETKKELFEFNHLLEKRECLLTNYLFSNSNYVVFSIPEYIKDWIEKNMPTAKIYHQSVPFVEEILLNTKAIGQKEAVYVNIHHSFIDVAFIKNSSLQLFNSFDIQSMNDFRYFLLNIYDQLKISPTDVPIIFSGFVRKNDEKVEQIKKFIKHVHFFVKPSYFHYSFHFENVEEHYFTNMLNLYQCG